jgi:hypothetical protein
VRGISPGCSAGVRHDRTCGCYAVRVGRGTVQLGDEPDEIVHVERFARGLESWEWIGIAGKTPVFASVFGDVFFRADDGFGYLDTLEGSLTRAWADARALKADLATADGQDRYLLAGLAFAAESRGLIPAAGQVYDFKVPPVLGGALEVDNVQAIDFVVGLHIAGQLHDQVRGLPPGTRISGFIVSDATT